MIEIEQKFKIGDVVVLKSGSPDMTVSKFENKLRVGKGTVDVFTGFVFCTWFINDEVKEEKFNQEILILK